MLQSMTGFGQAEFESDGLKVKVEVKSLNSKFLDLNLKMPREISDKETEIRTMVSNALKRGKVSLLIDFTFAEEDPQPVQINEALLKQYFNTYKSISNSLGDNPSDLFRLALHSPDVMSQPEEGNQELDWTLISKAIEEACENCQSFRKQEGTSLSKKLDGYISSIEENLRRIETLDGQRIAGIRSRIDKNLDEIRDRTQVDSNRFEQELIYYIEKIDITEEKVRLQRHLDYYREVAGLSESQGKKLSFISQEIGREINTIGSKANDADVQKQVVGMKDELEKIKEQLLNII